VSSPFADLDAFLALPRVSGLALSGDGSRLLTSVATLSPDRTRHVTALWEVDPAGERPARRLTRSRTGEADPVFAADGSLLFTSARPDPDGDEDADEGRPAALWQLPAVGEARVAGTWPGGLAAVAVARTAGTLVGLGDTLPASGDGDDDATRRARRKERGVGAVLHAGYPVRHWDADLGPGEPRLVVGELVDGGPVLWRDLTPEPGRALDRAELDVSADGRTVVTTWRVAEPGGAHRSVLVSVDTATGERRTLADDRRHDYGSPRLSPDGGRVAVLQERRGTATEPVDTRLLVFVLGEEQPPFVVGVDWDRWPAEVRWAPDGAALLVTADEAGGRPVFRVDLGDGEVTRLTGDRGHYTDLQVSPDGAVVYALRDAVDAPPAPVRLCARAVDQQPVALPGPADVVPVPGTLTEVHATAEDGTALRSWLVLPEGTGPHPLLLWAHGGPLGSWNGWSWRWQPWRLAALGYAVLLPDPALSTGYGLQMVRRGWGQWGGAPYDDVLALTDAALERPDLDAARTAMMGGSYGGYLASWTAGHTGRFRAVVTHAGLWDLKQFSGTTDVAYYWLREMTPEMVAANNPRAHLDAIRSPMLVVHGDRDYRVPVGEGLRLWWDLCSRTTGDSPHRFLLFPDEGHWVLKPQNAKAWYETVEAFLAWHVLGGAWVAPDVLA
jgi:dipeptidyl aminopeptidase/acylaminoacyl peptidase